MKLNFIRCGNVAAILELDENLQRDFTIFEVRDDPTKFKLPTYLTYLLFYVMQKIVFLVFFSFLVNGVSLTNMQF